MKFALALLAVMGLAKANPMATFETVDACELPEGTLRIPACQTINGFNNNEMNTFGEELENLVRILPADYIQDPVTGNWTANPREAFAPDARTISNTLHAHGNDQPNGQMLSDFAIIWGQFMDHDLALTPAAALDAAFAESAACPADLFCGDGVCGAFEFNTAMTDINVLDAMGGTIGTVPFCAADCGATCGDGMCIGGEDECSCPQDCEDTGYRNQVFNIPVRAFDPAFDAEGNGGVFLPLVRSITDGTVDESMNPREQVNLQTSFIDASTVYGPELERTLMLRDGEGCLRTVTIEGEVYMPFNGQDGITLVNDGNSRDPTEVHVGGDERVNEQGGLFGMHTLWVREHNFQAARIAATAPKHEPFSDEEIFQLARHIVIGETQFITYEEWLPLFIGELSTTYAGYNDTTDAGVSNEFQHGVYRLGHTMLNNQIQRIGADGETFAAFDLALADTFFRPETITLQGGLDPVWRGMSAQVARAYDPFLVDAIRIMLFGPPLNAVGMDLAALNIQRAREHGIDDYNDLRVGFGLNRHNSFPEVTQNRQVQLDLHALYGDLEYIDPWTGALSEDVFSGTVGQLAYAVLDDQFRRLRDGDRFHYLAEGVYSAEDLEYIRSNGRFSQVVLRNSGIACLPENAFVVDPDFDYSCSS